jgi:hypothetical protein
VVRRGYRPSEVHDQLRALDAEARLLAADRDALLAQRAELARRAESSSGEIRGLREQVRRLSRAPRSAAELSGLVRTILDLALEEAGQLRRTAEEQATRQLIRVHGDRMQAQRLRDRLDQERHELSRLRVAAQLTLREAQDEAERLVAQARWESQDILADAYERADRLERSVETDRSRRDRLAREQRIRAHRELRESLTARRTDAEALIERELSEARDGAQRVVAGAREQARRLLEQTRRSCAALHSEAEGERARADRLLGEARRQADAIAEAARAQAARRLAAADAHVVRAEARAAHSAAAAQAVDEARADAHTRVSALREQLDRQLTALSEAPPEPPVSAYPNPSAALQAAALPTFAVPTIGSDPDPTTTIPEQRADEPDLAVSERLAQP